MTNQTKPLDADSMPNMTKQACGYACPIPDTHTTYTYIYGKPSLYLLIQCQTWQTKPVDVCPMPDRDDKPSL